MYLFQVQLYYDAGSHTENKGPPLNLGKDTTTYR